VKHLVLRSSSAVAVLALGLGAASPAFAQHGSEPAAGEHASESHEASASGEGHEHHLQPVNWTNFGCGARGAGAHPLPPPFMVAVTNFMLLVAILYIAVQRAVNPALASRRAAVEVELTEAQRLRTEAEALHKEYSERVARMEQEFATIRADMARAGEAEYAKIIEHAGERAEQIRQEATLTLEHEFKQLRDELLRHAVAAAHDGAEKALRTQVTGDDQAKLADQFITRLDTSKRTLS